MLRAAQQGLTIGRNCQNRVLCVTAQLMCTPSVVNAGLDWHPLSTAALSSNAGLDWHPLSTAALSSNAGLDWHPLSTAALSSNAWS